MSNVALKYDEPPAEADSAETGDGLDEVSGGDSLFGLFVDEVDAWARQALAANGFGDSP